MIESPSPAPVALKDVSGSVLAPIISGQLDQERARKSFDRGKSRRDRELVGVLLAVFTGVITLLGHVLSSV